MLKAFFTVCAVLVCVFVAIEATHLILGEYRKIRDSLKARKLGFMSVIVAVFMCVVAVGAVGHYVGELCHKVHWV